MPPLAYLLVVFRSGEAPELLPTLQTVFGDFGAFFEPILTEFFNGFVNLADAAAISLIAWLFGYYVVLILVFVLFSLFTFLVTFFTDKIDRMRGV